MNKNNIILYTMDNIIKANIIASIHKLFIVFVIFGCLLPKKYLILHIITIILVPIGWKLVNMCILTKLENGLKNRSDKDYNIFLPRFYHNIGININDEQANHITNLLVGLSFLISIYRYFIKK
jgi:hypothetical protein